MKWMKHLTDSVSSLFKKKEEPPKGVEEELKEAFAKVPEIKKDKYHLFTEEQKLAIVKMMAHGWSNSEIQSHIKETYDIKASMTAIENYKSAEKWKPVIKKFRDEFVNSTDEVPGSHKRVRLERAERMYDKAAAKGDIKFGLLSIEQQRKEFDKHENNTYNILNQQYNYMSDEEVKNRKEFLLAKLNKKELKNGNGRVENETWK